jgi:hypothetical protein
MPFTQRYIRVETEIQGFAAITMINPFDISYYGEAVDNTQSSKPLSKTILSFRNGTALVVDMYLYEFELLLNEIKHV